MKYRVCLEIVLLRFACDGGGGGGVVVVNDYNDGMNEKIKNYDIFARAINHFVKTYKKKKIENDRLILK